MRSKRARADLMGIDPLRTTEELEASENAWGEPDLWGQPKTTVYRFSEALGAGCHAFALDHPDDEVTGWLKRAAEFGAAEDWSRYQNKRSASHLVGYAISSAVLSVVLHGDGGARRWLASQSRLAPMGKPGHLKDQSFAFGAALCLTVCHCDDHAREVVEWLRRDNAPWLNWCAEPIECVLQENHALFEVYLSALVMRYQGFVEGARGGLRWQAMPEAWIQWACLGLIAVATLRKLCGPDGKVPLHAIERWNALLFGALELVGLHSDEWSESMWRSVLSEPPPENKEDRG